MGRIIRLLLIVTLAGLAAFAVARLRASRTSEAALGGSEPLRGSLDTWPEVPTKNVA